MMHLHACWGNCPFERTRYITVKGGHQLNRQHWCDEEQSGRWFIRGVGELRRWQPLLWHNLLKGRTSPWQKSAMITKTFGICLWRNVDVPTNQDALNTLLKLIIFADRRSLLLFVALGLQEKTERNWNGAHLPFQPRLWVTIQKLTDTMVAPQYRGTGQWCVLYCGCV